MPVVKTLSAKERQFVAEYLVDKNGTAASQRAGYTCKNHKDNAWKLLQRPRVKAAVTKALKDQEARTLIGADEVLLNIQRLSKRAEVAREFHAAIRGQQLLGLHYKLFTEKHEHGGLGGGPVQFQITEREADL